VLGFDCEVEIGWALGTREQLPYKTTVATRKKETVIYIHGAN